MKSNNFIKKSISIIITLTIIPTFFSFPAFATTKKTTLTSAQVLSATEVKLKWKKISSVNGYEIYQKTNGKSYKKIKTISNRKTTSFKVKNLNSATKYIYKIRTFKKVKSKKQYSVFSATKSVTTKPITPVLLSALVKDNSALVKWTKISGAKGYVIYSKNKSVIKKIGGVSSSKTEFSFKGKAGDVITARAYIKADKKNLYSDYAKEITVVNMTEETTQEPVDKPVDNNEDYVTKDILDESINSLKNIIESGYVTQEKLDEHINGLNDILKNNYVTKDDFQQHTESLKTILAGYVTEDVFNSYSESLTEILNTNYVTNEKLTQQLDALKEFLKTTYMTEEKIQQYLHDLKTVLSNSYVTPEMMEEYFAQVKENIPQGDVTEEMLAQSVANLKSEIAQYYTTKENLEEKLTHIKNEIAQGYATKTQLDEYFNQLQDVIEKGYVSHESIADYLNDIFYAFSDYVSKEEFEDELNRKIQELKESLQNSFVNKDSVGNPWKNKNWTALGTSLTSASSGKYVEPLAKLSGLNVTNKGVDGAVMGGHILMYAQRDSSLAKADIVTVEGSVNDFAKAKPLGNVGDTVPYYHKFSSPSWDNGGTEEGTFAGACYQVFKAVLERAPKATVVCLTDTVGRNIDSTGAFYGREKRNSLGLSQMDYNNMLKAVAQYMGVIVIDTATTSGITQEHPEYYADHIHHSEAGGEKFAQAIWNELKHINFSYNSSDTNTENENATIVSSLKGKRIAVLGDSISCRNLYNGSCYTDLIEKKTGCTFIDYTVTNSKITKSADDTNNSFVDRYSAMEDTADAVIVMGGTFDFNTSVLGEFNSTYSATFYGAMNELLANLINKYAGKPIVFFSPIMTASENYTIPLTEYEVKQLTATDKITYENISAAMSLKCRQYGVKCVDLSSETGINGYDRNKVYFIDELHPTVSGMQKIAGVVHSELEKQFMYSN